MKYVALVRGINVGGKNLVSMATLRSVLEAQPLANVSTYIQSGNILFESRQKNPLQLSAVIEDILAVRLGVAAPVVVISGPQLDRVIRHAPPFFGLQPAQYRYDVAFLKPPAAACDVVSTIRLRDGVDQAFEANDVIYFQRLTARASESQLPRLVSHPAYKSMTIRNWKTTTELHRLIGGGLPADRTGAQPRGVDRRHSGRLRG